MGLRKGFGILQRKSHITAIQELQCTITISKSASERLEQEKPSRSLRTTYKEYRKRIYHVCANRASFVTRYGYTGLAPWNAKVVDKICILYGGCTPFLLREVAQTQQFELVGEVYVYGIMGGEALEQERGLVERMFEIV